MSHPVRRHGLSTRAFAASSEDTAPGERVIRFVLAGLANTAFGYAVYALFVLLGAHPQFALAVQFVLGVLWNFSIHGRFVFGTRGYGRFPYYVLAYIAVYLFNASLLHLLIAASFGPYLAQAIALVPTVVLSYLLVSWALTAKAGGDVA